MISKKIILKNELYLSENEDVLNFYDMESLDGFVDNDMISGAEGGFMLGYLDA